MASVLTVTYARFVYLLFTFLLRSTYKPPPPEITSFQKNKHTKMRKLAKPANKLFNVITSVINRKTRYDYTMPVNYQGCKLLIRPFIFSEIVMVSGLWEVYVRAILDKELGESDIVVDVGANIGVYAIPIAKRVSKVIAFEPHPKTSEMLEKSIKLNKLHNIILVKKAVGDSRKKVSYGLSVIPMNSGVTTPHKIESIIETESVDLDTVLASENRINWLLIDVEGFEVNVLMGARTILRKYSPKIIIEADHINFEKVNEILKNEGYSITHLYHIYYYAIKQLA